MNLLDENIPDNQRHCLDVGQYEVASFIRRFLRHPALNSRAKRMGKVVRVIQIGMRVWKLNVEHEARLTWPT